MEAADVDVVVKILRNDNSPGCYFRGYWNDAVPVSLFKKKKIN